jgi:hypothetical protein
MNPEGRKIEEKIPPEYLEAHDGIGERKEAHLKREEPYIVVGEKTVSYLGVEVPRGQGGRLVPKAEEFKEEYFHLEGHYKLMRDVASALILNKPILLEGGTGVYNKTTTIARMCHDLNMNYCKVNFDRETAREDVIGGHILIVDKNGKEKLEWYDGDLMYAIRNGGVAFLDEYNRQSKLAGIINPIIDAILNGRKEITNPYNANERVNVHPDFRLLAAQNPPGFEGGHEYTDRSQLPAETFGRWIYRKLPIEYSEEEQNKLLAGVIGEKVDFNLPLEEFRKTGEGLPVSELAEVPGMVHWRGEIINIFRVLEAKSTGAKREMAKGQRQNLYFNPRLIMSTLPQYIARFYKGDINETVKNAFETCVIGMYSSEVDQEKIREILKQASWKPPATESKRKGLKSKESSSGERAESLQEAKERADKALKSLFKSHRVPDKIKERLKPLEAGTELGSSLREQYERQTEILKKAGILQELESGETGIKGIDGKEYALPSQQEVAEMMEANRELVERKQEQGFTRLLLVPFGMKLDDLTEKYRQAILKHHAERKLFATKKNPDDSLEPLELDEKQPLWKWDGYNDADVKGNLVYQVKKFSRDHGGKTKQEILAEEGGWQVLLIEDMPNIPRAGKGEEIGGRKQLEANSTPEEYLKALKSAEAEKKDPYHGESGMMPEGQLAYAILHLEETDQVIDDWKGNGSVSYQAGAYFPSSGAVPYACWDRGDRRAYLGGYYPDDRDDGCGVRPAVRI